MDGLDLAAGRVTESFSQATQSSPYAVLDPGAELLAYYLGVHVLAKVPNVRSHAAPDLEHLPFYALRYLAHDLNCPFNQLMFCWKVRIVRWGLGSSFLSMLAPDPASIPPIKSSIPETMSAAAHMGTKSLSAYTPARERMM